MPNSLLELGGEENPPGLAHLMTGNIPRCAKYGYRLFRSIHDKFANALFELVAFIGGCVLFLTTAALGPRAHGQHLYRISRLLLHEHLQQL